MTEVSEFGKFGLARIRVFFKGPWFKCGERICTWLPGELRTASNHKQSPPTPCTRFLQFRLPIVVNDRRPHKWLGDISPLVDVRQKVPRQLRMFACAGCISCKQLPYGCISCKQLPYLAQPAALRCEGYVGWMGWMWGSAAGSIPPPRLLSPKKECVLLAWAKAKGRLCLS